MAWTWLAMYCLLDWYYDVQAEVYIVNILITMLFLFTWNFAESVSLLSSRFTVGSDFFIPVHYHGDIASFYEWFIQNRNIYRRVLTVIIYIYIIIRHLQGWSLFLRKLEMIFAVIFGCIRLENELSLYTNLLRYLKLFLNCIVRGNCRCSRLYPSGVYHFMITFLTVTINTFWVELSWWRGGWKLEEMKKLYRAGAFGWESEGMSNGLIEWMGAIGHQPSAISHQPYVIGNQSSLSASKMHTIYITYVIYIWRYGGQPKPLVAALEYWSIHASMLHR